LIGSDNQIGADWSIVGTTASARHNLAIGASGYGFRRPALHGARVAAPRRGRL
jgi:hypothetical protein